MSAIHRLQDWFIANCEGDWEHGSGIVISTLDNPGWSIDISVEGTPLAGKIRSLSKTDRSPDDWIHASCDGNVFKIRCGPGNLEEAVLLFLNLAEPV